MITAKYAVYQYGYAIYGVGESVDEAISDAKLYVDELPEDMPTYKGQNVDGEMYIIDITDRLYYIVRDVGGSDVPITHSGYPYVWDIAGAE